MKNQAAKALRIAHLATAITIGFCISGMDVAPLRVIFWSVVAVFVLSISYHRLYFDKTKKEYKPFSDTPIDDEVRRDLGIKE